MLFDVVSRINIIKEELFNKLKDVILHPSPFNLKMTYQRKKFMAYEID